MNLHSFAHLLHTFRHDSITGLQPFVDDPHGVNPGSDFDGANAHLIVAADYRDEVCFQGSGTRL